MTSNFCELIAADVRDTKNTTGKCPGFFIAVSAHHVYVTLEVAPNGEQHNPSSKETHSVALKIEQAEMLIRGLQEALGSSCESANRDSTAM